MSWRRIGVWSTASIVGVSALVLAVGWSLPEHHIARGQRIVGASPQAVWDRITDFEHAVDWRSGLESVTNVSGREVATYEEQSEFGVIRFEVVESVAPERLRTRVIENSDFGGTWTYELRTVDGGTDVSITEDGEIFNPLFRVITRFVLGYDATLNAYLDDLEQSFAPER